MAGRPEDWTEQRVNKMLDEMFEFVSQGECYYLGWLLDEFNLYEDWWGYIRKKCKNERFYKDNKAITDKMKRIEQRIEKNLVKAMLTGKVKETTGIFTLKSKHKWVDKQQVEHRVEPIQINLDLKRK